MVDWRDALLLSSVVVAPCTAQAPAAVRSTAGCYSLSVTEWSPPDPNPTYHRVPHFIRLDTVHARLGRGWVLSPNMEYPSHAGLPPSWRLLGDTLRLAWSNGFQVTGVSLARTDSGWSGEAIAESDARPMPGSPPPRAHVTARRAACPDSLR